MVIIMSKILNQKQLSDYYEKKFLNSIPGIQKNEKFEEIF